MRAIFVIGYPDKIGGAHTELAATVRLWRMMGHPVTLLAPWKPDLVWQEKLGDIGCTTVRLPRKLTKISGLAGSTVVGFCSLDFLKQAVGLRELGCRLIWAGCMTELLSPETNAYKALGGCFDRHIFQSKYQRRVLASQLERYGYDDEKHGCTIRGVFFADEYSFRPYGHNGQPFSIGRISRAALDKYPLDLWARYRQIQTLHELHVLGWSQNIAKRLGPPPAHATCHTAGSMSTRTFLSGIHAVVQPGGTAKENWPRIGLEAMASGVPLVVDKSGGWPEMVEHLKTGCLCNNPAEFAHYTDWLADDESARLAMIHQARESLGTLADVEVAAEAWANVLNCS